MTTTEALAAAKNRLGIASSDTSWDTQLTDFFDMAVDRLFPRVQKEIAAQETTPTIDDYGEATISLTGLSTPLDDVRLVEATEGNQWYSADRIFRHSTNLRVRDLAPTVTSLRIYGLKKYVVSGAAVDIPEHMEQPVLWYMMSEFFDYLGGNKSRYNIYAQSAGARTVDNMRDESDYYEAKADDYIEKYANLYGSQ